MRFRLTVIWLVAFAAVTYSVAITRAAELCFEAPVGHTTSYWPSSVTAADLDEDGDQDLAVAADVNVAILMNNGDGTYAAAVSYAAGATPLSVVGADLDGDEDIDLATANTYSNSVSVLKNNGDGTYSVAIQYMVGSNPGAVVAADVDGDGDEDLATSNANGYAGVSILKNNDDGTFAGAIGYPAGGGPESLCAADLDGDGDQDLAVADYHGPGTGGGVSVLMNNGDGSYVLAASYEVGAYPTSIVAVNLDADGDPDLAVANSDSDNVSVLRNNGDGTFAPAVYYRAGNAPSAVFAADLDRDGDQDLAVADYWGACIAVLRNDGNGALAEAVTYPVGERPTSVFAANLDKDSYPDLAVACNRYNGQAWTLINCIHPPPLQVDILPGACPNVLSVGSRDIDVRDLRPGPASAGQATISVALLGTRTFDVTRVDPSTLTLAGLSPAGHKIADISRPIEARESDCGCLGAGPNGFADLVLQFRHEELIAALSPYSDGEVRRLTLTGQTKSGIPLSGSDCLTITTQPIRIGHLAEADGQIPSGLGDCYPNPFNGATTIAFSLSSDEHVRLEIYNVLGQRVATLVDAHLPSGPHEAVWDASGNASGVYVARLRMGSGVQTRKMVLIR